MSHPLDVARLKVVRAVKHLQTLKNEIANYLSENPHEFPIEDDGNTVIAREAVIKEGCQSPDELSCIVSECVGPLRHSLDYIVWALASKWASPAPVCGKNRDISFPIEDPLTGKSLKRFEDMASKYSFPASAIDRIKSIQPNNAGYESLNLLATLTNRDKHCLPLLTVAYVNTASIKLVSSPGNRVEAIGSGVVNVSIRRSDPVQFSFVLDTWALDEHGAQIKATLNTSESIAAEQLADSVKVNGQVTGFVALKDVTMPFIPVERSIEQILECVTRVVASFEKEF